MIKHFVILGTYSRGNVCPLVVDEEAWSNLELRLFDSRVDATRAAEQTPFGMHYGFNVYTTEVPG